MCVCVYVCISTIFSITTYTKYIDYLLYGLAGNKMEDSEINNNISSFIISGEHFFFFSFTFLLKPWNYGLPYLILLSINNKNLLKDKILLGL